MLALLLAAVGCGSDGDSQADPGTAPAVVVTLWFSDDEGVLRSERRTVPGGAEPLESALAALADGPSDPTLLPALPEGTRVLGTGVADGVAAVDLSAEFEAGYPPGGAAAELAVLGPLVRTAAGASGAPRVRVLVEGRVPAPPGTQFDLSQPLAPGDLPSS